MSARQSGNGLANQRGKDAARAAFMKKHPGMFPDSVSKTKGHMGGCRTDGTHEAKGIWAVSRKGGLTKVR